MTNKFMRVLILLLSSLFIFACVYIELPEGLEAPAAKRNAESPAWSAFTTAIEKSDSGNQRIMITLRNDTGDWSRMQAAAGRPAVLTSGDGKTLNCEPVFISTGGHRLAPGFQMRGYTTGKKGDMQTQLIYAECSVDEITSGSTLAIEYESFQGILDDYDPEANKIKEKLEIILDEVQTDLQYPVAEMVEGLIQPIGTGITGLSDNVVTLLDADRTDTGLLFTWENYNPTKFALKTHIGTPPVIGSDGIIYGLYEILDMAPVPLTPANEKMEWTTEVATPQDVQGFYILLSVESNKPRTYKNYVVDIHEK